MASDSSRSFARSASDRIKSILAYWDRIRANRPMPMRTDFDPLDIPQHLSGILLLDVEGCDADGNGIYRYRVVGTEEVRNRGYNPTGRLVQEGCYGASLENALADYNFICQHRSFLYQPIEYRTERNLTVREQSILLPLSEDGENVTQILVYSHREADRPIPKKGGSFL